MHPLPVVQSISTTDRALVVSGCLKAHMHIAANKYIDAHVTPTPSSNLISDVVERFIMHFHQAMLDNNLVEIMVMYESRWNKLTEKYYTKTEWPETEIIVLLINNDQLFLILYHELYYCHVYSHLQPNIDEHFHSYKSSCELFNYLLTI
ncbi:hypothetical protein EWM64_g9843 [Hericium alpestre]|uniref:Uncharacterized protein n=1 Tax=Hericium alpestre TaxID=135208 RepID=A0A4Y9ZL70_9AGAM|nr:hypothetical protein EWM64_g9843 [Hericium alpestre]